MTSRSILRALGAALLIGALSGCQHTQEYNETFLVFGTLVDVTIYDDDPNRAAAAMETARADFNYMQRTWHAWKPSALYRINQLIPSGAEFSAGPSILPLIERSQTLSVQSHGLFNPAIGRLIALWGFQSDDLPNTPPPQDAIRALVAQHPAMADLQVKGLRLRSSNPAVQLDFGAFAKGYGIDLVIERLRALGIENLIVNAGGDLRAIGRHGERPWRIGIRNPRGEGVIASVDIQGDESVFTSGDYERYFDYEGTRYHHIIDPRTGYPARGTTSVTVIHSDGADADAAATALFVAGPTQWREIAKSMGVDKVMLIDDQGVVHMTPAMAERIHMQIKPVPTIRISPLE